jgi:hypothetical protein
MTRIAGCALPLAEVFPMKTIPLFILPAALLLSLAGCAENKAPKSDAGVPEKSVGSEPEKKVEKAPDKEVKIDKEAKIKAAIARLPEEDRPLAEAQKYCAVEEENRLGGMGKPYKVTIDGQPVFLCCKGCQKAAFKDPAKTLARVKELKEKAKKEAAQ